MTGDNARRVYRAIVLAGAAGALILAAIHSSGWGLTPTLVTIVLALSLYARFGYVIALLQWPAAPMRILLVSGFWLAFLVAAARVEHVAQWAGALVVCFAVGAVMEVYNYFTRQWAIGSDAMQATLRNDHLRGAAAAAIGAVSLLPVLRRWPGSAPAFVGLLIVVDWIRLLEMILRHRRVGAR